MLTRRTFLTGTAALATATPGARAEEPGITELALRRRTIDVNGKAAQVLGVGDGASGFSPNVGSRFRVRVKNELSAPSLMHWHGLTPPSAQDGVPGVSGPAIPPGGSADYDFPLPAGGTYFMHSHVGFQEQLLLAAPLIVRDPKRYPDWQEVVVMLADFSFRPPEEIYAALTGGKGGSGAMAGMYHMDDMAQPARMDMEGMPDMSPKPSVSRMETGAPDLNDVDYDAFLANDRTLADPDVITVESGGRVLLRLINRACMSAFHVDLGGLCGKLVAVDGQDVAPVEGARFPIAVAQRLDILLELPKGAQAFPVFFVLEGERRRTGVILASKGAHIERAAEMAETASPALDLALEAQLRAAQPLSVRKADREIPLDLTGDMSSYVWSINNVVWSEKTPPIELVRGQRVELAMTNKTMMSHPMHLHGHRFQVVEIDGRRISGALRDTVLVPPSKRVVVAFDADNPGHWAFHCHLLYHAQAGMFATFRYA